MSKKKVGIIITAVVVGVAAIGGGLWYFLRGNGAGRSSADKVYVEKVSSLLPGNSGMQNRYSGVVEPQETWEVNKSEEKTVKEVLVAEGDAVKAGTPLFEYDTEELKGELAQAELELEEMRNEIINSKQQINQLSEEKAAAPEEEKLDYTTQIQSVQNSIKQTEYSIESKKIEMKKKQESIDNAVVKSEIDGVVKDINEEGTDEMGNTVAYMVILATGDYRIKGTVSEQNVWTITEGQKVIIRSRVDEEQTWSGTISKVDTEKPEENNNENYYAESESGQTASKYPFYVAMDSNKGLMLGQHVFIEMDEGQTEEKEGIWLTEGYIVKEKKETYIWTANKRDRLEKRKVKLGEYDESLGEYEIVSGLSEDDYIAFPIEGMYEGVSAVKDAEEVDYTSPLYEQNSGAEGGEMPEDGEIMSEEEMPEEGEMMPEGGEVMSEEEMPEEGEMLPEDGAESAEGEEEPAARRIEEPEE